MRLTHLLTGLALALAPMAGRADPLPPRGAGAAIVTADAHDAGVMLTKTLAAFYAGEPNYRDMDTALQTAVKANEEALIAQIKGLGLLDALDYQGLGPGGVQGFKGIFSHGKADIVIGLDKDGKISTLWIKPTE